VSEIFENFHAKSARLTLELYSSCARAYL